MITETDLAKLHYCLTIILDGIKIKDPFAGERLSDALNYISELMNRIQDKQ
ncbi:hypothetical protein LCGC14_1604760 [marine sediment metagenome]|uniref:Uncharacterized protein n=1 Tax=marine sediment metagenome TaxID=412755 RepID=A0A0F9IAD7_9ZZZZ